VRGPGHQECLDDCLTCWLMRGNEDDVTWLGLEKFERRNFETSARLCSSKKKY
jgi:hypothetical protein